MRGIEKEQLSVWGTWLALGGPKRFATGRQLLGFTASLVPGRGLPGGYKKTLHVLRVQGGLLPRQSHMVHPVSTAILDAPLSHTMLRTLPPQQFLGPQQQLVKAGPLHSEEPLDPLLPWFLRPQASSLPQLQSPLFLLPQLHLDSADRPPSAETIHLNWLTFQPLTFIFHLFLLYSHLFSYLTSIFFTSAVNISLPPMEPFVNLSL